MSTSEGAPGGRCSLLYEQHAPMWVVKVADVLAMSEVRPHKLLKAEGLLSEWSAGMFTIFVSHQWLSIQHPDPDAEQLQVLQAVLRRLIANTLKIDLDVASQFFGGKVGKVEIERLGEAYIWLDYFCVPQLWEGQELLLPEQTLYIRSIPNYVDHCFVFLALVPRAIHRQTGEPCSVHSWLQRGWCRTELWCNFLSTRSKHLIVVTYLPFMKLGHFVALRLAGVWLTHLLHV